MNSKQNNLQGVPNETTKIPQEVPSVKDRISIQTKDKVEAAKNFIESILSHVSSLSVIIEKYSMIKKEEMENQINWDLLKKKMDEMNLPENEKDQIKKEIQHKEAEKLRLKSTDQTIN